jgi:hypothetical protein
MRQKWRSRSAWTFFGLSDNYIENVYEQLFNLKYYGGWSFFEAYNLPVSIRNWMLDRLVKQKKQEADAASGNTVSSSRGATYNYKT